MLKISNYFCYQELSQMLNMEERTGRYRTDSEGSVGDEMRNLYVKNIDPTIREGIFLSLFKSYGTITRINVNLGRGIAYVEYEDRDQAAKAVRELNNFRLGANELYVTYFQNRNERSLALAGIILVKGANLQVQNLSKDVDDAALRDLFGTQGTILSLRVEHRQDKPTGRGWVCFGSVEDGQRAMRNLDGFLLKGRKISVKASERTPHVLQPKCNLKVENLDRKVDDDTLDEVFSAFGQVVKAKVMTNSRGLSKGYGYVCMKTTSEAENALRHMNGTLVYARKITVMVDPSENARNRSTSRSRHSSNEDFSNFDEYDNFCDPERKTNLYVKNLHPSVDEEYLKTLFGKSGPVRNVKIIERNTPTKYGYVNMATHEGAVLAIQRLKGREINGVPLYVDFHQTKREREEVKRNELVTRLQNLATGGN